MSAMPGIADFDSKAAGRRINDENRLEDERIERRRIAARAEAGRLADAMRATDPGVKAIRGFGSTFEDGRPYRMDSDIDIAIEGGDLLSLEKIADASCFKVDLVDISDCDDGFSRMIKESGTSL